MPSKDLMTLPLLCCSIDLFLNFDLPIKSQLSRFATVKRHFPAINRNVLFCSNHQSIPKTISRWQRPWMQNTPRKLHSLVDRCCFCSMSFTEVIGLSPRRPMAPNLGILDCPSDRVSRLLWRIWNDQRYNNCNKYILCYSIK